MQFTFPQSVIDQVRLNPLICEPEFKDCVTDSDYCLAFYRVSTRLNQYTGLAKKIKQQL